MKIIGADERLAEVMADFLLTAMRLICRAMIARDLGASAIGSECLRKVQFDWWCKPAYLSQTRDIFARGHFFEELSRQHLIRAGFTFAPAELLSFSAAGGLFRGHADGILVSGPELPEAGFPCLWEHKCLGDKGWRSLERDGLEKAYPQYTAQVSVYQAYLEVTEHPAIFTAVNGNTCARLTSWCRSTPRRHRFRPTARSP